METTDGVRRLAEAIGYPDEVPAGARSFMLTVDGFEIKSENVADRVRLSSRVWSRADGAADDGMLVRLADYAAGRILREESVLAWDPDAEEAFLWQDFPVSADAADLRRFFEVFVASLEWWCARVDDASRVEPSLPEFVILP